jgi:hypothetical protein
VDRVTVLRDLYRDGELPLERLQPLLEGIADSLEGDAHPDDRNALASVGNELEMARFTMEDRERRAHALRVLDRATETMRVALSVE